MATKKTTKLLGILVYCAKAIVIVICSIFFYKTAGVLIPPIIKGCVIFFGPELVSTVALYIFILGYVSSLLYYFIKYIARIIDAKFKTWFIMTIIIMFCSFYIGFISIYQFTEVPNLNLKLFDLNTDKPVGELICEDESRFFVRTYEVKCSIIPQLKNYTMNIEFIGENTTYKTIHNKLSFFPPKEQNVQRILFKFEGYDEHNHLRKLGVLKPFTFMTEEDKTKKIKDFVAYFLGLIAIVLFSIPNMMINLKKLYDEK